MELLVSERKLAPSMAVTILANLNMFNLPMPASVLERLDFSLGFEAPGDELVVEEALSCIEEGLVKIGRTTRVDVGVFKLQLNPIRGCRPRRIARDTDVPLELPFNQEQFHFAMPECEAEIFDEITLRDGLRIDLLLNRYPFAPYQFIWVPNRLQRLNQFLEPTKDAPILEAACDFIWNDEPNGSVRLAYNSIGAHASVNHLHFQGFVLTREWEPPFEKFIRRHVQNCSGSGRIDCYFRATTWISRADGVGGLKTFIQKMNASQQPYHLYFVPAGIACFPRKHQANHNYFELLQKSSFTTGFAFFELLGEIVSPTRDISNIDLQHLETQIRELYDTLVPSGI